MVSERVDDFALPSSVPHPLPCAPVDVEAEVRRLTDEYHEAVSEFLRDPSPRRRRRMKQLGRLLERVDPVARAANQRARRFRAEAERRYEEAERTGQIVDQLVALAEELRRSLRR